MQANSNQKGIALPHLAAWRYRAMLSQAELSALSGVSRASIHDAETGKRIRPSNGRKLAKALAISPEQLLQAPGQEPVKQGGTDGS